ncbi:SpaH/EbpB family LPXTG-anchored major pilin [Bifidobacterium favimelis]|uniref:SpaH/EbpB family LPXTG-anchored major pilin n=1 Tax=Bifidobacterium favimelis TaxID=3122979 RepID=A0ABU8ZR05_9BIFI
MTQPGMKRLFASVSAVIAAVAMGAAGVATAAAVEGAPKVDLQITNAQGRTFVAMRVGNYTRVIASPSDPKTGSVAVQTVDDPSTVKSASAAAVTSVLNSRGETVPAEATNDPIAYVSTNWGLGNDGATTTTEGGKPQYDGNVRLFLNAIWQNAGFKSLFDEPGLDTAVADANGVATFSGLVQGEYIVVDKTPGTNIDKTLPMFVSTLAKTSASAADALTIPGTTGSIEAKSSTPAKPVKTNDKNDYSVGDTVRFTITDKVPSYIAYNADTYKFIVHDTLSKGLKFSGAGTVTVKVGATVLQPYDASTNKNGYVFQAVAPGGESGSLDFDLSHFFSELIKAHDGSVAGQTIEINYETTLTSSAIDMKPGEIHNDANVEYSNDPDTEATGKTDQGRSTVYTFDFDVVTLDKASRAPITGAEYTVTRHGESTPMNLVKVSEGIYRPESATDTRTATESTLTVGGDGKIVIKGVASGSYDVKETKAPAGYMNLQPLFTAGITATYKTVDDDRVLDTLLYSITSDKYGLSDLLDKDAGHYRVFNVKNLTQLPLTGAAGIMFLVTVGVLLVAAGSCIYLLSVRNAKKESGAVRV